MQVGTLFWALIRLQVFLLISNVMLSIVKTGMLERSLDRESYKKLELLAASADQGKDTQSEHLMLLQFFFMSSVLHLFLCLSEMSPH